MIDVLIATSIFSIVLTTVLLIESIVFMIKHSNSGYTIDSSRIIRYFILIWITTTIGYYFIEFLLSSIIPIYI